MTLKEEMEEYKMIDGRQRAEKFNVEEDELYLMNSLPADVMAELMEQREQDLLTDDSLTRYDINNNCSVLVIRSDNVKKYKLAIQLGERRNQDVLINQYISDMAQQKGKLLDELRESLSNNNY